MVEPILEPIRLPDPALADGRVRLRPWQLGDADAVTAACQDPEIARWVPIPWPYLREHAVGFIERTIADWAAGLAADFAITDQGEGHLLGAIGVGRDPL
jgi:RimJ/RimL family protein N-acetyltransferase